MSKFNKIESTNEQSGKTREEKIKNAISASLIVTGAASAGYLIHDSLNEGRISKWLDDIQPKSDVLSEDPTLLEGVEVDEHNPSVQSTVSFEDDLDAVSADITNEELEEVEQEFDTDMDDVQEERDIVHEIRCIIENINSQPFEVREKSRLTTDAGLIYELGHRYPELGFPRFTFWSQPDSNLVQVNLNTKEAEDGMSDNTLFYSYQQLREGVPLSRLSGIFLEGDVFFRPNSERDVESTMIGKGTYRYYGGERWQRENVLLYTGNLDFETFYQPGDILSMYNWREGDVFSRVQLAGIIGKRIDEDGKVILTIAYSPDDTHIDSERHTEADGFVWTERTYNNPSRNAKVIEVNEDEFNDFVGDTHFVIRRDWKGALADGYDVENWDNRYSVLSESSIEEGFVDQVTWNGARMYTLPFNDDGTLDREGKITESILPPGLRLKLSKEIFVSTPDGSIVTFGLVGADNDYWGIKNGSIVTLEYFADPNEWENLEDPIWNRNNNVGLYRNLQHIHPMDYSPRDPKWYGFQYGDLSGNTEEGWRNVNGFPIVTNTYDVGELEVFLDLLYQKENVEHLLPEIEEEKSKDVIQSIVELQTVVSNYDEQSEELWNDYLKRQRWYIDYMAKITQDSSLTFQQREQVDLGLKYLTYGNVEGQPLQGIPFQVASSLLYPELNIQSVGGATTVSEGGEIMGAVTVKDLVRELMENPEYKSIKPSYGGTLYRDIQGVEFLQVGDTILNPKTEDIGYIAGIVEVENSRGEMEKQYIYVGANRHGYGDIFTVVVTEGNAPWILGDREDIFVLRGE